MLRDAFPRALAIEVEAVLARLPSAPQATAGTVGPITIRGEPIVIPSRIYGPEPTAPLFATPREQRIVHCIYSRHADGHVRQRHLRPLLDADERWVVPFVVALLGEYVLEILSEIDDRRTLFATPAYREFVAESSAFVALTEQRAISYWNAYYRRRYPRRDDYPGVRAVRALRAAAPVA